MPVSATEAADQALPPVEPLSLYVHWPFCLSKCPYCDFNSHVRDNVDAARFTAALLAEIDHFAARLKGRALTSIFFGGGTPSLAPPETVAAVIDRATGHWRATDDIEITLEANPTSVEAGRFAGYRAAGVNRLSLGIQALEDAALQSLGRQHSVAEALAALEMARQQFPRISFDLIYARPGQTAEAWRDELSRALDLAGGHLSLYQLTLEEGTPLTARHARGEFRLPEENLAAQLYELTQDLCGQAGLPAYEISNHAAPGMACRHNILGWQGAEYVGVGPGAHGRINDAGRTIATRQWRKPETWLGAVEAVGHGGEDEEVLDPAARAEELIMSGLRLRDGIDLLRFRNRTGREVRDIVNADRLSDLQGMGLVETSSDRLAVTLRGRLVLNSVLQALLT